ncbi:MAG: DNA-binding protein [Candidatus Omnitrophota bacterium]|nr:DNA-binding protein [Candidatus Omnitrophota bacterium]
MINHRLHRLKKPITQIALLTACCLLLATYVFAKPPSPAETPVSSLDLIEHAKDYDGKIVYFQGEVVGEVMRRGDFAWINVHDGSNALGIWAKSPLFAAITFTGTYKSTGDIIGAKGIFHRACLEHGGDLDIHADSLIIIKQGQERTETFHYQEKIWVLIIAGVTACLLILRLLLKILKKT